MLQHLRAHPLKFTARVVVVGAHGFVGRAIVRRLERDGVPVLGLVRRDVDLLAEDATDRLTGLLRPDDSVVAVAAMAPCKNGDMLRDNVALALSLARACARASVAHVVNVSSDAVYADSASPLTESSPTAPDTLHGVMHLARELIFKTEIRSPLAILRPSLIYGAADPHNGYGPNRFRRLAAQGQPIVLFGEGEERRDHVLIDDVAELAVRVIFRRSIGALNIATGVVTSFRDIAEAVVKLSGKRVAVVSSPRQGPMPHNGYRAFDIAMCRAAFPDFDYTPLLQGLEKAQGDEFDMSANGNAFLDDTSILHPGNAAAAIILTSGNDYLLQLRDAKPGIFFPDCWGCFGGGVSLPDGSAEECLRREIKEELGLELRNDEVCYFSNFTFDLSFCGVGVIYRTFYEVRLSERQFSSIVLGEGADVRAFDRAALSTLRLTPYDAFALWLHDNRRRLLPMPEKD